MRELEHRFWVESANYTLLFVWYPKVGPLVLYFTNYTHSDSWIGLSTCLNWIELLLIIIKNKLKKNHKNSSSFRTTTIQLVHEGPPRNLFWWLFHLNFRPVSWDHARKISNWPKNYICTVLSNLFYNLFSIHKTCCPFLETYLTKLKHTWQK